MWLERFGLVDARMFYIFSAAAAVIVLLALIGMLSGFCINDPSPGCSASYFLHMSTIIVTTSVMIRAVNTEWSTQDTFSNLCQVYVIVMVIGWALFFGCIFAKLAVTVHLYRQNKNKVYNVRSECQAAVIITVVVVIAVAVVVAWQIVYTPSLYVLSTNNVTFWQLMNLTVFECRGHSPDGAFDGHQVIWRIAASSYCGFFLVVGLVLIPILFCTKFQMKYRTSAITYVCISLNSCLSISVAFIVKYFYHPPERPHDTIMFGLIAGLQLWTVFFANVMLLIAKVVTYRNCKETTVPLTILRHVRLLADDSETKPMSRNSTEQTV